MNSSNINEVTNKATNFQSMHQIRNDALSSFNNQLNERIMRLQQQKSKKKKNKENKNSKATSVLPKINHNRTQGFEDYYVSDELEYKIKMEAKLEEMKKTVDYLQKKHQIEKRYEQKLQKYNLQNFDPHLYQNPRQCDQLQYPPSMLPYFPQTPPQMSYMPQIPPLYPQNPYNNNYQQNSFYQNQSAVKKPKKLSPIKRKTTASIQLLPKKQFTKQQKQILKRKLKAAVIAVYFTILFPKYVNQILSLKYDEMLNCLQSQQFQQIRNFNIKPISQLKFFDLFNEAQEEQNLELQKSKNKKKILELFIIQDDIKFTIPISIIARFICIIIEKVTYFAEEGYFDSYFPTLLHIFNQEFPLNHLLVEEQLRLLNFNPRTAQIQTDQDTIKCLIISFFLIKQVIFGSLLNYEQNMKRIKKMHDKNKVERKLIRNLNQKVKISTLLMYITIDRYFIEKSKNTEDGNYNELKRQFQAVPQSPLQFQFQFEGDSEKKIRQKTPKYSLIKNMIGKAQIEQIIQYFLKDYSELIMSKVFIFSQRVYIRMKQYQAERNKKIKQFCQQKTFQFQKLNINYRQIVLQNPDQKNLKQKS